MNAAPTVSVVIPCYNGAGFIKETLDSVLSQNHAPLEVIVIDDGSTDNSAAIAEAFGPPVRVIRQPNQGESVARNRGIDEAKGEWIAFLDADDLWLPNKLEQQLAAAEDDTIAVHTELETFGTSCGTSNIAEVPAGQRYAPERLAVHNCFVTPSALIVRRSASPRFPTWTQRGEDLIYFLDLVTRGPIALVPHPLTRYRKHPGGQTSQITGAVDVHRALLRWLETPENPLDSDQQDQVRQTWCEHLVSLAWSMKERRRWEEHAVFRQYLTSFAGSPCVDQLLSNRLYPRFVYPVCDFLRAMSGPHHKQRNRT